MQPEPLTNPQPVSAHRPGGEIGARPGGSVATIEAWTDQHPANVARLMADGAFYGDARRGPSVFRPAIRWMREDDVDVSYTEFPTLPRSASTRSI